MRLVVLLFCLLLGVGAENAYAKAPAKNTQTKNAPAKSTSAKNNASAKKTTKATTKSASKPSATKKTDAQINEQKNALKKLESDLAKKRQELALLETEEKGVLNTISILDQNLNQTRTYLSELTKSEVMLERALVQLSADIDSLDRKIETRREAMKKRIRTKR